MDITAKYTTSARVTADKDGKEKEKIIIEEKDFLIAEILLDISNKLEVFRLR